MGPQHGARNGWRPESWPRRAWPVLRASSLVVLCASPAVAACDPERRAVSVRFTGPQSAAFERSVLADLAAGLARSDAGACSARSPRGTPSAPGGADLQVDALSTELVMVRVQLHDAGGQTRLDREVNLSQVPPDSRGFAVALAADELLRAGWAELEARDSAEALAAPPAAAPEAQSDTLSGAGPREVPPAALDSWHAGARAAFEHFSGGQTLWGSDVTLRVPLPVRLELELAPGARWGSEVSAPHGHIDSRALTFAASIRFNVLERGWRLAAGLGLEGAGIELQGANSEPGATAARFTGFALYGQALLSASLPLAGPLWVELGGVLGAPLRALEGTDDGRAATAASGVQLGAWSGLSVQL